MPEPFRQAVQMCLPKANIVVDKFHVRRRVDEAPDKAKNNRIKVIKRMAYGYRNIDNFRRRIFLSNNEIAASTKASGGFHAY